MKCKNLNVEVRGFRYKKHDAGRESLPKPIIFNCIVTNDELGKTLSISDGNYEFTIPFKKLEKYLT